MKLHYLKAYGFAVIGVFHTSGPLVAGQYVKMVEASSNSHGSRLFVKRFGLQVEITPPVMTNNDGTLRDPQPISKKGYTIKLLITRTQTASVRQHGMARITREDIKRLCWIASVHGYQYTTWIENVLQNNLSNLMYFVRLGKKHGNL